MNLMRFTLLISALLTSTSINAASFNCDLASTDIETTICSNTEISKLDEDLSASYKSALKNEKTSIQIKKEQRAWIKKRNQCADIECIRNEYINRISELSTTTKKTSGVNSKCTDRPECWPEGSAMQTALLLNEKEQGMKKKAHTKYQELAALISMLLPEDVSVSEQEKWYLATQKEGVRNPKLDAFVEWLFVEVEADLTMRLYQA